MPDNDGAHEYAQTRMLTPKRRATLAAGMIVASTLATQCCGLCPNRAILRRTYPGDRWSAIPLKPVSTKQVTEHRTDC
jgi:hypothetical protein